MRVLSTEDLRWVAGGQPSFSGSFPGEEVWEGDSLWTWDGFEWVETVVVTPGDDYTPPGYEWPDDLPPGFFDEDPITPGGLDTDVIGVSVEIGRAMTSEEADAVAELAEAIQRVTAAVNALADNAVITLPDNSTITGAELKDLWSKLDIILVSDNYNFANNSGLGEADYNNGNPIFRSNMENLTGYAAWSEAGLNYLLLHELAHMTGAQRADLADAYADNYYSPAEASEHEQTANDIALAIATAGGISLISNPGYGYNSTPLTVTTP